MRPRPEPPAPRPGAPRRPRLGVRPDVLLLVDAVDMRDYPVIQALVLLFSLEFILIYLIVDMLYGLINPTIRYR